jgi:glycosyltransferase involved in cell wall biosynthesis
MFSIIIPTYNRANLITKTLDSILKQTYQNFEVIIVDDGSTDNTSEVLKPYLNDRIKYYFKENQERAAARNFGTKLAQGNYINWFDSDDIMLENHLQEASLLVTKLNNPEVFALGYANVKTSNEIISTITNEGLMNDKIYKGNYFACNPVFVRKDIALENKFNEIRKLSGSEDYELWLRLASKYPFYSSNIITSYLIQHDERSVLTMRSISSLEDRFLTFIELISENKDIIKLLKNNVNYFFMINYLILSVDLAAVGNRKKSIYYLIKAIKSSYCFVVNKTFYAILKHLMFHK